MQSFTNTFIFSNVSYILNVHILSRFFFSTSLTSQSLQSFFAKTEDRNWTSLGNSEGQVFPHTQAKYQRLLKFPKAQHSNTESTGTQKAKHRMVRRRLASVAITPVSKVPLITLSTHSPSCMHRCVHEVHTNACARAHTHTEGGIRCCLK